MGDVRLDPLEARMAELGNRVAELEDVEDRRKYRLEHAEDFFARLAWPVYFAGLGLALLFAVIAAAFRWLARRST